MQNVELGEWNAPRPYFLHAGLVFVAPGIREGPTLVRQSTRVPKTSKNSAFTAASWVWGMIAEAT